jgi:hypothetical protein
LTTLVARSCARGTLTGNTTAKLRSTRVKVQVILENSYKVAMQ